MRKYVVLVVLGAVMGVVTGLGVEQRCSAGFEAPGLIRLEVDPISLDFGMLTLDDYERGFKNYPDPQIVQVRSNRKWSLTIVADMAYWDYAGDESNPNKPCSDLEWGLPLSPMTGLTTTPATVAQGGPGKYSYQVFFRVLVGWDDTPAGAYKLSFTYTLTTP